MVAEIPAKGDRDLNALLWWLRSGRWADRPSRRTIPERLVGWLDHPHRLRSEVLLIVAAAATADRTTIGDLKVFVRFYGLLGEPHSLAMIAADDGVTIAAAEAARRRADQLCGERLTTPPLADTAPGRQGGDASDHDPKRRRADIQNATAAAVWELTNPGLADVMSHMRDDQKSVTAALLALMGTATPTSWASGQRSRQRLADDRRRANQALRTHLDVAQTPGLPPQVARTLIYHAAPQRDLGTVEARYADRLETLDLDQPGINPQLFNDTVFAQVFDPDATRLIADAVISAYHNEEADMLSALTVMAEALAARGDPFAHHGLAHLLALVELSRAGILRGRRDPRAVHAAERARLLVAPFDRIALAADREIGQTWRDLGLVSPARAALATYRRRLREAMAHGAMTREDIIYERGLTAVLAGAVVVTQVDLERRPPPGGVDLVEAFTNVIDAHHGIEAPDIVANAHVLRRRILQLEVGRHQLGADNLLARSATRHVPHLLAALDDRIGPRLWRVQNAETILAVSLQLRSRDLYTAVVARLPDALDRGHMYRPVEDRVRNLANRGIERGW